MWMRIHTFHLVRNKSDTKIEPTLYAVTTDKKLVKRFKESRNMKKFHYEIMEYDKLDGMKQLDSLKSYMLTEAHFVTKNIFGLETSVAVTCTWSEESDILLSSDSIYLNLVFPYVLKNPNIFNISSLYILDKVDYVKIWNIKRDNGNMFVDDTIPYKKDELELFIKKYGWLLKEE